MEIFIIAIVIATAIVFLLLGYLAYRASRTPAKELPRNVQNRLSPKARAAIAEITKRLRGMPYEAEYIVDADGEIIYNQTQYDSKFVEFSEEQIAYLADHPGTISIHNHDTDTPPSITDLAFANRTRQSRLIVVSPNYTYTVVPPASGWRSGDELDAIRRKHMRLFRVIRQSERFVGVDRDGAILMMTETEYETTDEAMAVIASEFGYHYVREDA